MRKFIITVTVCMLALTTMLFAACGEGDTASEIAKIESELDDMKYSEPVDVDVSDDDTGVAVAAAAFDDEWTLLEDKNYMFESEVDGLLWTPDKYFVFEKYASNDGYKVRGFSDITEGRPTKIIIPNEYKGAPVVMIDTGSFRDNKDITSVKMCSNMRYVYANAFRDCPNLTEVVLGSNVKKIHHAAFRNCKSLKEITIPAKVTRLEPGVFAGCESLENVVFQRYYYTQIEKNKEVKYAYAVSDIAVNAFTGCTSLKTVDLPETLTGIGSGAFRNSGLKGKLNLSSVHSFGALAFSNCTELEVTYKKTYREKGKSVKTTVGTEAFYKCKQVTAI